MRNDEPNQMPKSKLQKAVNSTTKTPTQDKKPQFVSLQKKVDAPPIPTPEVIEPVVESLPVEKAISVEPVIESAVKSTKVINLLKPQIKKSDTKSPQLTDTDTDTDVVQAEKQEKLDQEQEKVKKPKKVLSNPVPKENIYFQAVGIIEGDVTFDEEDKASININGKEFRLAYTNSRKRLNEELKKQVEATGCRQQLIVYPKIIHFPKREQAPLLWFELAKIKKSAEEETTGNLAGFKPGEFILSGLWQFIPVCHQAPCISVFKNFSRERIKWIKDEETSANQKVSFMKAAHIPILWRDAPVSPFRYNSRAEKDKQAKQYFVQVKAKFLPEKEVFGFQTLLGMPLDYSPRFLKAKNEDKTEALKEKRKREAKEKKKAEKAQRKAEKAQESQQTQ